MTPAYQLAKFFRPLNFGWQVLIMTILVSGSLFFLIGARTLDASDFMLIAWRPGQQLLATGSVSLTYPYPLWTAVVTLPFTIWPPYVSMVIWLVSNIVTLSVSLVLLYRLFVPKPRLLLFAAFAPLYSLFLPVVTSLWLGQLTVFLLLILVLSAYAIKMQRWTGLGVLLGLSFIKPQVLILLVGFMLLAALWQRRWKVIIGFGGVIIFLVAISLPFITTPRQIIGSGISAHLAEYIGSTSTLWGLFITLGFSWIVPLILSLGLIVWIAYLWLPMIRGRVQSPERIFYIWSLTTIVNQIVIPYNWMHSLALLIFPIAYGFFCTWQLGKAGRLIGSIALITVMYPIMIMVFLMFTAPLNSQGYQVIPALLYLPVIYFIGRQYQTSQISLGNKAPQS